MRAPPVRAGAWLRAHRDASASALRELLAPSVTLLSVEPTPPQPAATTAIGTLAATAASSQQPQQAAPVSSFRGSEAVLAELSRTLARCAPPGGRVRALGRTEHVDVGICLGPRAPTVLLRSCEPPLSLDPDGVGGELKLWLVSGSIADPEGAPPVFAFAREARVACAPRRCRRRAQPPGASPPHAHQRLLTSPHPHWPHAPPIAPPSAWRLHPSVPPIRATNPHRLSPPPLRSYGLPSLTTPLSAEDVRALLRAGELREVRGCCSALARPRGCCCVRCWPGLKRPGRERTAVAARCAAGRGARCKAVE